MRSFILIPGLILVTAFAAVQAASPPVKIIFDTDYETDCDDPGALAVLHALADNGEAEILATIASGRHQWGAAAIDVVNTYYGRPDIPIGATRRGVVKSSRYNSGLASRFPHDTGTIEQVPEATQLYRQVLAAQPDASVVIVTVGYMTNLEDLLKSGPDAHSALGGVALVQKKVKQWVCMGGNFFHQSTDNTNFRTDPVATMYAVNNWPTNITFVGREVGSVPSPIRAGAELRTTPADNPVRVAYELYFGGVAQDRHCADLTTVLYAVRGLRDYWDIETNGYMHFINAQSDFEWRTTRNRDHDYLIPKGGWQAYTNKNAIMAVMDELLLQAPRASQPPPLPPSGDVNLISAATYVARSAGWDSDGKWPYTRIHDGGSSTEAHALPGTEQWIEYDFGSPHSLGRVRVYEDNAGSYSLGQWRLAYYDGTWHDAFPNRAANAAGWHEVALADIVATKVRFYGQAPSGAGLEIYEFECYGAPADPVPSAVAVEINFQPANAPTVSGYAVDAGAVFGERGNGFRYGWSAATDHARDRNRLADQRADTLNHMQKAGSSLVWEIALPNGLYEVALLAGDPAHFDSVYKVAIEGVVVLDVVPTSSQRIFERTALVSVADGRLTISSAAGAVNNKISAIAIHALPSGGG